MFDAITPAVVAADLVTGFILTPDRASRLVEQKALDPSLPGLEDVIDALYAVSFETTPRTAYEAEVQRAVQNVVVEALITLASNAPMPQVRAIAALRLRQRAAYLARGVPVNAPARSVGTVAQAEALTAEIRRFLERPAAPAPRLSSPNAPPGAPIGEAALEWLRRLDPGCAWMDRWPW